MRIISLAPGNTEILFTLGAGDDIIARTGLCDYPSDVQKIPVINPKMDEIRKLGADLILTSSIHEELAASMEDEGLPVAHISPKTLGGVFDAINEIGDLIGKTDEATDLVNGITWQLEKLRQRPMSKKPRLYAEYAPNLALGNWMPEIADIAAAEYPIKQGRQSREMSLEDLQEYDPEIIVCNDVGSIKKRKGWGKISAVKSNNVHMIEDALLNRPGPRLVRGCAILAQICSSFESSS